MTAAGKVLVIGLELGDGALLSSGPRPASCRRSRALIDKGTLGLARDHRRPAARLGLALALHRRRPRRARRLLHLPAGAGRPGLAALPRGPLRPADVLAAARRGRRGGARCSTRPTPIPSPASPARSCSTGAPGRNIWRRSSSPAQVLRELEQACGRYPLGLEAHDIGLSAARPGRHREARLVAAVRSRPTRPAG